MNRDRRWQWQLDKVIKECKECKDKDKGRDRDKVKHRLFNKQWYNQLWFDKMVLVRRRWLLNQ